MYNPNYVLMTDYCNVQRATHSTNALNQVKSESFTDHITNLKCKIIFKNNREFKDGVFINVPRYYLYYIYGTDLNKKDRIIFNSHTFVIESIETEGISNGFFSIAELQRIS